MNEKVEIDSRLLEYLEKRSKAKSEDEQKLNDWLDELKQSFVSVFEKQLLDELEIYVSNEFGMEGAIAVKVMKIFYKYGVPLEHIQNCIDEILELFNNSKKEGDKDEQP